MTHNDVTQLASSHAGPSTPPSTFLPLPDDTPIKRTSATYLPWTTHQKYRIDSYHTMGKEIIDYLVGPMPVHQFLNDFFPPMKLKSHSCAYRSYPRTQRDPFVYQETASSGDEQSAYMPFVRSFNVV